MCISGSPWARVALLAAIVCAIRPYFAVAADEPALSQEQIAHFLLTAKVVNSKQTDKGMSHPWRLTLSDGTITHDASFQTIDEHKSVVKFAMSTELAFVDSYKYNIAAYRLAELLGIGDMLPVYVERTWQRNTGSLSWWLPVQMDEGERLRRKILPPDPDAWNEQMNKVRVLDELVYDTDPNLTNVLIGNDWKLYRVDFTRAFRLNEELQNPKNLVHCERKLFERLKTLNSNELAQNTKGFLNKGEIKALMVRRDKIVKYFEKLIAEKGENEVLY